ncbi:MAG: amidohydrolase family protein [Steroidobacteraceae bacterium]|nr:amidohydrolase family protein [Steroidobacteraceae bacterium]MDW8260683.1 amidohydrolase family protein [Gammaproteobacteria bacterium]
MGSSLPPVGAIDIVCGLYTPEALRYRPGWQEQFFAGKMKSKADMRGVSLDEQLAQMAEAGIERAFLFAPKVGRKGLPGCFHLPYELVARAVEKYPGRFYGMAGIDPFEGMNGVRALEDAVRNMGFIGAHLYPHWFELPPDHAKYYPFYAKCCELGVPIQLQVGQSMVYSKEAPMRSVGRPIALDAVACDFPELKIIGIHVGIPWTDEMIAMAWKHDNVYIGSDAHSPKYWPQSFVNYINTYGQDKVLFGTDFPVLGFKRTIDEILALNLRPEPLRKLLRDNALRVYRLQSG